MKRLVIIAVVIIGFSSWVSANEVENEWASALQIPYSDGRILELKQHKINKTFSLWIHPDNISTPLVVDYELLTKNGIFTVRWTEFENYFAFFRGGENPSWVENRGGIDLKAIDSVVYTGVYDIILVRSRHLIPKEEDYPKDSLNRRNISDLRLHLSKIIERAKRL